jgi:hypothetical protein
LSGPHFTMQPQNNVVVNKAEGLAAPAEPPAPDKP